MASMTIYYKIKENSLLARLSAAKLKQPRCAIVVHRTIYLWGIDRTTFLNTPWYLHHELQHLYQYQQHGTVAFIIKYLIESAQKGYYNNKFEVEARAAEDKPPMADFVLLP